MSRIFRTSVASVYPHYLNKVEKKGRTKAELDRVIEWLTGFDESALGDHLAAGTTFEDFFAEARLNPNASSITGVICGVRVEDIEDPLPGQAGRRASQGQVDGEGPEDVAVLWSQRAGNRCAGDASRPATPSLQVGPGRSMTHKVAGQRH